MSEFVKVARLSSMREGLTYPVTVDDEDIVLVREGDNVYALTDNCTHQDFPLAQGKVLKGKLKCRAHGAEFCLKTGKALCPPAFAAVETWEVKIDGDDVLVKVD